MVGENGPEIFAPRGVGDILPAGVASRLRGGGSTVVNVTVKATDPAAFRASRHQIIADAKRSARMGS